MVLVLPRTPQHNGALYFFQNGAGGEGAGAGAGKRWHGWLMVDSQSSEKRLSKTDLRTTSWTTCQVSPCRACTPGSSANTRRSGLFTASFNFEARGVGGWVHVRGGVYTLEDRSGWREVKLMRLTDEKTLAGHRYSCRRAVSRASSALSISVLRIVLSPL